MTLHPRALPGNPAAAKRGTSAPDVPGLAYYSVPRAFLIAQPAPVPTLSAAAEALEAMYGYYNRQV